MNSPTPGHEHYRVGEVMKLFDVTDLTDLSNIRNDYVLGMHPLGGTVVGGEIFDAPRLRKSLEDLQKKTAQWAQRLPQALKDVGDDRSAEITRRAQKMRGPFND